MLEKLYWLAVPPLHNTFISLCETHIFANSFVVGVDLWIWPSTQKPTFLSQLATLHPTTTKNIFYLVSSALIISDQNWLHIFQIIYVPFLQHFSPEIVFNLVLLPVLVFFSQHMFGFVHEKNSQSLVFWHKLWQSTGVTRIPDPLP